MTFPVSPTNGQTTVVNNISYQYTSASNSWRRVLSNTVTATNILGGATGSIPYQSGPGTTVFLPIGTSTFVLQSVGGLPAWVSTASLGISGGGGGSVGSPFAGIFTITNTTQATSTITGALQVVGGVGVGGNLFVGGTGIFGSALNFTPTNSNFQYGGNRLGYLQLAIQNANSGTTSTTDIVAFTDNGNDLGGYIDFGITSSAYTDPLYNLSGPGDGYLYVVGTGTNVGKLTISTYQPQDIIFSTGGGSSVNEQARFKHGQGLIVTTSTHATSTTTGALVVNGGVGIGKDLYVGGTIYQQGVPVSGSSAGLDVGKVVALVMGMAMP